MSHERPQGHHRTEGETGPVSAWLEADLRGFVHKHGVALWHDLDGHYSAFVAQLQAREARLGYAVRGFRGSHLELLFALEGLTGGTAPGPLLVHLPGFAEDRVHGSPLEALSQIGKRYRKSIETLVTDAAAGRVTTDDIAAFLSRENLDLSSADAWLNGHLSAKGGGMAERMRNAPIAVLMDDLLNNGEVARCLDIPENVAAWWHAMEAATGLHAAWRAAALPGSAAENTGGEDPGAENARAEFNTPALNPADAAYVLASWALAVEFTDDLARAPINPHLQAVAALPRVVVAQCCTLAQHLRLNHSAFYRRTADEAEALLADEVETARAEDLGKIDTFRFEEHRVLQGALDALLANAWQPALRWARQRLEPDRNGASFWLSGDLSRRSAWQLVYATAQLGEALWQAGPRLLVDAAGRALDPETGAGDLALALEAYQLRGAAVDRAHRLLEQHRVTLLYPQLTEFERLQNGIGAMRERWCTWADQWARDFNALCDAQGYLPEPPLQQRSLFDDVVRPLAQDSGIVAYFVVDALRYELGGALYDLLKDTPASVVKLDARFAELPTVTEVGMNVLAPVSSDGQLTPTFSPDGSRVLGFAAGEFRVSNPDTRRRAMHARVGGATCPWLRLDEVVDGGAARLRSGIAKARLVVVHSLEIDEAGEKGAGLLMFDHVINKLRAAWRLLREAGVKKFVFTSDHGFLLLDEWRTRPQNHGRRTVPSRRHVFATAAAKHADEARVPLARLGYRAAEGAGLGDGGALGGTLAGAQGEAQLVVPRTTTVFNNGQPNHGFVHGGNSLQERVIPVLTVIHKAAAGGNALQYRVIATAAEGVAGLHCVRVRVESMAQGALDFGGTKTVELALQVREATGVAVELVQVRGAARLVASTVQASVGVDFEVFFRLSGELDARVSVEVYHPSNAADVTPGVPESRFAVSNLRAPASGSKAETRRARTEPETPAIVADSSGDTEQVRSLKPPLTAASVQTHRPSAPAADAPAADAPATAWLDQLPEGGVRQAFAHLARHGTLSEAEVIRMLGSPRGARQFANKVDEWARVAPFSVRTDTSSGGKQYIREGGL